MQKSDSIANLIKALCKFHSEVDPIKKDADNPYFKSKYADLAGCIETTKIPLASNGLAVSQVTRVREDGQILLVTLLMHISGEYLYGEYLLTPIKTDPQSMGGAMTYARRYNYLAILGLAPEDDDGAVASGTVKREAHKEPVVVLTNPGEYVITFGQFYKGKKIKDLPAFTLKKQIDYVLGLSDPYPAALEFLKNAQAFVGEGSAHE